MNIPNTVIYVVGDVLGSWYYSHTKIDTLFGGSGFPGDPPPGNCVKKAQEWLRRANGSGLEPLDLLAIVLHEFMNLNLEDDSRWETGAKRVNEALLQCGLRFTDNAVRAISTNTASAGNPTVGEVAVSTDADGSKPGNVNERLAEKLVDTAMGVPRMAPDQRRNSALNLLMLLAEAYYRMLEATISTASLVTALDLELNDSYIWLVSNLSNLLARHEDLVDFPQKFEPLFPDLYPSTIGDLDWQEMIAPDAERFLSTVQRYVQAKGIYQPEQSSEAWGFVELFRPSVMTAMERASRYEQNMREHYRRMTRSIQEVAKVHHHTDADNPLNGLTEMASADNPTGVPVALRSKVFISYSHKDTQFLHELLDHLKPLERAGLVDKWSDQQIEPGSHWLDEIEHSLATAKVAVLLVTRNFLASEFINEKELGPLLKSAESNGVVILWVPVRACSYRDTPLSKYQAVIPPDKPLAEMRAGRDKAWVKVCDAIKSSVA